MTTSTQLRTARTSDSSDRCAPLPSSRTAPPARLPRASRFGTKARRFLDALMRSLAAPHI